MKVLQLEETQPLLLSTEQFSASAAISLHTNFRDKVSVEFPSPVNYGNYRIQSNGYVGYIPIDDNHAIRILPKVPTKNIFRLLEYAYNLKSFELFEGTAEVEAVQELFERLATILAKRVLDRNRQGLYAGYVHREESLPHVRGRINVVPTSMALLRGATRLICEFEEHTPDLEDNQLLAWTLYQLRHFRIERPEVRAVIRKAYRELANKVDLRRFEPRDCLNRMYHRLNQDYAPMHQICRFFLEQAGPGLDRGDYALQPFLVHMPGLFEAFVAEWLRMHLPTRYHLSKQFHYQLESEGRGVFRIDLVLSDAQTDQVIAVLDTKYKRNSSPDESDIQQAIAYAVSMQTDRAILIYPSEATKAYSQVFGKRVKVQTMVFDISQDPDVSGWHFMRRLLE